jgi:hypothetical protein
MKPEDDEVIEQVSAFPHHAGGVALGDLNRHLARLLDQLSGELVPARLQQLECPRMIGGRDLTKRGRKLFQHLRIGVQRISSRFRLPAAAGMNVGVRPMNAVRVAVA